MLFIFTWELHFVLSRITFGGYASSGKKSVAPERDDDIHLGVIGLFLASDNSFPKIFLVIGERWILTE